MSKPHRNEQGITVRHGRKCASRGGGRCDCKPTFQAQAYDAHTNTRPTKTFKTITAARQWRQDAGSAIRRGELSGARGPRLDEAAAEFVAAMKAGTALTPTGHRYKPSVIRGYEKRLDQYVLPKFGTVRLGDIRHVDVQRWVDRLATQMAATGVDGVVMPLRSIYRRANRTGVVTVNPTRGLQMPARVTRREGFATPAEAEAVIAVLGLPERAVWATGLYAGPRRGELAALRWEDVDLAKSVLHIRRGWDDVEGEIETKSRKHRRVAIPGELRDHLLDQRAFAERVFATPKSRALAKRRYEEHRLYAEGVSKHEIARRFGIDHMLVHYDLKKPALDPNATREVADHDRVFTRDETIDGIAQRARGAMRAAGLRPLGLHECRHSYASFLIHAGANAKAISAMLGHSSITMTFDRYGHLMPGAEDEVATLLGAYLQKARDAGPDLAAGFPGLAEGEPELLEAEGQE